MATEQKKFKDWFDREAAERWVSQLSAVYPEFEAERFFKGLLPGLEELEFKDRVQRFAKALRETLPQDIPQALQILSRSFPEPLPDCESPTDGWLQWPAGEFIALYCVDYPEEAFQTMVALTQVFSSEFAVRPFLVEHREYALEFLRFSVGHESPHVRRWCSEGLRSRLPWGQVLKDFVRDPGPVIPVLEALKDDPELYVRRSVANNLNDIAKDHPDLVVEICGNWLKGAGAPRRWVVRHALRSLIKKGNPEALALMGFGPVDGRVESDLSLQPESLAIGGEILLRAELKNLTEETVAIQLDYVLHLVRKRDKMGQKVFKWKSLELQAGESVVLEKRQKVASHSTRTFYPGTHAVELQLNGERFAKREFELHS